MLPLILLVHALFLWTFLDLSMAHSTLKTVIILLLTYASVVTAYPVCTGSFACDVYQTSFTGSDGVLFCCPGPVNQFVDISQTASGSSCQYPTDCSLAATYLSCNPGDTACPPWMVTDLGSSGKLCCPGGTWVSRETAGTTYYQCTVPTTGQCSSGEKRLYKFKTFK